MTFFFIYFSFFIKNHDILKNFGHQFLSCYYGSSQIVIIHHKIRIRIILKIILIKKKYLIKKLIHYVGIVLLRDKKLTLVILMLNQLIIFYILKYLKE